MGCHKKEGRGRTEQGREVNLGRQKRRLKEIGRRTEEEQAGGRCGD